MLPDALLALSGAALILLASLVVLLVHHYLDGAEDVHRGLPLRPAVVGPAVALAVAVVVGGSAGALLHRQVGAEPWLVLGGLAVGVAWRGAWRRLREPQAERGR